MTRKLFEFTIGGFAILTVSMVISFTVINLFLGCETWEKELWTQYNSCIMPKEFLSLFNPFRF